MLIGEVARRTGVPAGAIRFYERKKLVAAPTRSRSGYRQYAERVVAEINFIKKAQRLGMSLQQIREIVNVGRSGGSRHCDRVVAACENHLEDIERRMAELRDLRKQLQATLRHAQSSCEMTTDGFCRAIADD